MDLLPLLENDLPKSVTSLLGKTITMPPVGGRRKYRDFKIRVNSIQNVIRNGHPLCLVNITVLSGVFTPADGSSTKPAKCKWDFIGARSVVNRYFRNLLGWEQHQVKVQIDMTELNGFINALNTTCAGKSFVNWDGRVLVIRDFTARSNGTVYVNYIEKTDRTSLNGDIKHTTHSFVKQFFDFVGFDGFFRVVIHGAS